MAKSAFGSIADPPPPLLRHRPRPWLATAFGLALTPIAYEVGIWIVGLWRSLAGHAVIVETPILEAIATAWSDFWFDLTRGVNRSFVDPAWQPAWVIGLGLVLTVGGALVLLRSRIRS
jgi:hypothetical protein